MAANDGVSDVTGMTDLDLPIALRRARRSSAGLLRLGLKVDTQTSPCSSSSSPKTPRRRKRAVRFSDPGPVSTTTTTTTTTSGLTPMVRRTSIATTPSRRRASVPANLPAGVVASLAPANPISRRHERPAKQTHSPNLLHQTVGGRIERRIRRNGLRDMLNKIEQEQRRKENSARAEVARLRAELRARDREIYELQNATVVIDTERIWDLEQQVDDLRAELVRRTREDSDEENARQRHSWSLPATDPFTDDFVYMTTDEENFGDSTIAQLQASTPSRVRSSFPTPPATSPTTVPATPCSMVNMPLFMSDAAVQTSLPDPAHQQLEEELESLQLEICKLTTTLDSYKSIGTRVNGLLSAASPASAGAPSSACQLEAIESQIQSLLHTMSEQINTLAGLTTAIKDLGFPGNDANEMISSITSSLRTARLEIEYINPGESTLPLTSHGAEIISLLLNKLRTLANKVKEDQSTIDQYRAVEKSLRKELDTRVTVTDELAAEVSKARGLIDEKDNKIRELERENDELKGAVDGYVRAISSLERQMSALDEKASLSIEVFAAQAKSKDELLATKDASIAELETNIAQAAQQTATLLKKMQAMEASHTKQMIANNRRHGAALAGRDSRVVELRNELYRVSNGLHAAHLTIQRLRVENGKLETEVKEAKKEAKDAMDAVKHGLQRVLQISQGFLDGNAETPSHDEEREINPSLALKRPRDALFDDLPRRESKKIRRRFDSGIALLPEDEAVDV